jgi:hypothetical protein
LIFEYLALKARRRGALLLKHVVQISKNVFQFPSSLQTFEEFGPLLLPHNPSPGHLRINLNEARVLARPVQISKFFQNQSCHAFTGERRLKCRLLFSQSLDSNLQVEI